jgi:hypothetical protein
MKDYWQPNNEELKAESICNSVHLYVLWFPISSCSKNVKKITYICVSRILQYDSLSGVSATHRMYPLCRNESIGNGFLNVQQSTMKNGQPCHIPSVFTFGIATGYGLNDRDFGIKSPGSVKNLLFSTSSRPALGLTKPPTQWVPQDSFPWDKAARAWR